MKKFSSATRLTQLACLALLMLVSVAGEAQTLSRHNWYFGNSSDGLKFNRVTNVAAVVNNQATPFGTGGSSVASDQDNGNLLFYTDGANVFDLSHTVMPNGSGLNANTAANQPTAICGIPGQPGKYFIFTNTAAFTAGGTVSSTVVDMTLFGNAGFPSPAFGDVVTKNVAVPGLAGVAEGMITVPHANGDDFWLITQQVQTMSFSATLINAASFVSGTFTTVVSGAAILPTTAAHLSYNEILRKIAVASQDPSTDAIILNFNPTTGVISFDRTILNSGFPATGTEMLYDFEWSPSGQFLYLSRFGEAGFPANVFQYDYTNSAITLTPILPAAVFRSFGLRRAPDNFIYHLYQSASGGSFLLGRINKPDTVAAGVNYDPLPFGAMNFNGMQFPSFLPRDTIDLQVSFTFAGTCANSPTTFFPSVKPGADSLFWDFGDGNAGRGWGPINTYTAGGTYNVRLLAYYRDQIDSVVQGVTINDFPLQVQMTQDTTACRCEFPPPRSNAPTNGHNQFQVTASVQGGTGAEAYVWSNGQTGNVLRPDSSGYYYVVVTDPASGCSGYAAVNVREYGLQQQTFNKWYFGNLAGIDFTPHIPSNPADKDKCISGLATGSAPPVALAESAMNAPEGCSIICDRNGETIFYTDGFTVYDRTHTQIDTGIGGSPASTQSSLIVPIPGDETLYYIFTTQAINGTDSLQLSYSVFDIKQNNGNGAIVKKSVLLFAKCTERITASGQWLIVHEYGNNTFRSYRISNLGIGDVVYTSIGSDHSLLTKENGEGYMKLGPGNTLAVPLSTPGTGNHIELFHLNDTTGKLNNYRDINLNQPTGQIYGIEFSPAGNKLFATLRSGGSSFLFEYSIDSLGLAHFKQQLPVSADLGAIQTGPDGQIYVATNDAANSASLGTILPNEDTTATSTFNLAGFALAPGTNSRLGLPNFVQQNGSATGGPDILVAGLCSGDSTEITGVPTDQIDEYMWQVKDAAGLVVGPPAPGNQPSFKLLLQIGDYTATLRLTNRCGLDTTLTRAFTINQSPADPTKGVVLCTRPVTLDANPSNAPNLQYFWISGETTKTISVSEQLITYVLVADVNNCFVIGRFLVTDPLPFDIGPDMTICEDNNTPALDVGNLGPGITYQWRIDGVPASSISTQAVDTDDPGVFTYEVTVTDPAQGCSVVRDKVYTVNVSPAFTLTGAPTTACNTATGTLTLQLNTSTPAGGPLYQYFISGAGSTAQNGIDMTAPSTITIPNRVAGTYSAVVSDQISGCTISATTGITDIVLTTVSFVVDPCAVTLNYAASGGVAPYRYTFTNSATLQVFGPSAPTAVPFITPALTAGPYTVQTQDNANCIFTENITVTPNPSPAITFNPNLCLKTLQAVSTPAATTFTWDSNPPGQFAPIAGDQTTITLTPTVGIVTYIVTAGGAAGMCPATDSTTLNVQTLIIPTLTQTDGCQSIVTVTASPFTPGVVYRWYRNGVLDITLGGNQIILGTADHGVNFMAEILDPQSGCTVQSAPHTAIVVGPIVATLGSTPPCEDGLPFTLTATTTTPGVAYKWLLDNQIISGQTASSLSETREGSYSVEISKATCTVVGTLQITRAPVPEGELPNRVVICNDPDNTDPSTSSIDLDPGPFVEYEWTKNNLLLNYQLRVYTATSEGDYSVQLTNSFDCVATDQAEVLNECVPQIDAPNAFRPSSAVFNKYQVDLKNSEFWIISKFIEDDGFFIFVFNRWGEMVYSSTDRNFKWNGGYNNNLGSPMPPGTYSYVIKYTNSFRPDLGQQEKRGGVALLR